MVCESELVLAAESAHRVTGVPPFVLLPDIGNQRLWTLHLDFKGSDERVFRVNDNYGTLLATSSQATGTIPAQSKIISGTGISSTPCATPNCRRLSSRIFGVTDPPCAIKASRFQVEPP
jgi:hypothetical protein